MSTIDITKWSVLSEINEEILTKIKLFYVFGQNGEQVIIVTNDDNVYAYNSQGFDCLHLGSKNVDEDYCYERVGKTTKIEELCQKCVIDIQFGSRSYDFGLALTKDYEVFSWGSNSYGQLGNGYTNGRGRPVIIKELIGKYVTDIKCGEHHCLALTLSGEVYHWGFVRQNISEHNPRLMLNINGHNVISISCGYYHSMALTDKGDVYCWGYYSEETTHHNYNNNVVEYPCLVSSNISKISCGPYHCLMLSSDGKIYSFGLNEETNTTYTHFKFFSEIKYVSDNFIDIATTKYNKISVGLSKDGFCYVWGEQQIKTPTKLRMNKIIDVLEYCTKLRVTFDRIYYENDCTDYSQRAKQMYKFGETFNKEQYSDIAFKIENQFIYAQKLFLQNVCKHFDVMFSSDNWRECNEKIIEITQYSYTIYYAFIEYLYTKVVDIKSEDAIELLDLANSYFEDEQIRRFEEILCQLFI